MASTTPQGFKEFKEFSVADEQSYNHSSPVAWIVSHLLRYKLWIFSFLFAATTTDILFALVSRMTGFAFDEILSANPNQEKLLSIALIVLGLVLLRGVIDVVNSLSIEMLGQRLERDTRQELYLSLLGKSQTFHNRQRVGDIMARASNDVRQLNPMMNPGVGLIFESLVSLIVPLVFIANIHWQLLLFPVLFIASYVWALRRYMERLEPVSNAIRHYFGDMNASLNETITGIEVVKANAQEQQEAKKFLKAADLVKDFYEKEGMVQARYLPILLLGIASAAALLQGLYLLSLGQLSVGDLVAFISLMALFRFPAFISVFTFSLVQLGLAGARRILELIREENDLDQNPEGRQAPIRGDVVFDGVSFFHEGSEQAILEDLSFEVGAGQTIAVVGQTGSGKSTLTKLLNRIYDVDSGSIRVDGVDVRDWNLSSLRSQIAVIEQDIFLFSRSVAENIAFGVNGEVGQQDIEGAAKTAQAHDFIQGFQDGYDSLVGERGVTLSGGQRQRIAIARALLADPKILVLDDATSAIDSATEDAIQRAIDSVLEGRTTFIITHRLAQIRKADGIVVLDQGRIVDQGSHQELMRRCAMYQRMFSPFISSPHTTSRAKGRT